MRYVYMPVHFVFMVLPLLKFKRLCDNKGKPEDTHVKWKKHLNCIQFFIHRFECFSRREKTKKSCCCFCIIWLVSRVGLLDILTPWCVVSVDVTIVFNVRSSFSVCCYRISSLFRNSTSNCCNTVCIFPLLRRRF